MHPSPRPRFPQPRPARLESPDAASTREIVVFSAQIAAAVLGVIATFAVFIVGLRSLDMPPVPSRATVGDGR